MFEKLVQALELKTPVDQDKSEAIIALLTLLYQADGKVKLEEQDFFASMLKDLPWQNSVLSKETFHRDLVTKSTDALLDDHLSDYLDTIVPALKSDPKVLAALRELAVSDGDLDSREAEILTLVSNKMV